MSILLSVDVHGNDSIKRVKIENVSSRFPEWRSIRFLIVPGNWGAIWNDSEKSISREKELIATYDSMPRETLVVLGNHEGYSRIPHRPRTTRHGALVRQASDKVFILQNGNLYPIEESRFFIFGVPARSTKEAGPRLCPGGHKRFQRWTTSTALVPSQWNLGNVSTRR